MPKLLRLIKNFFQYTSLLLSFKESSRSSSSSLLPFAAQSHKTETQSAGGICAFLGGAVFEKRKKLAEKGAADGGIAAQSVGIVERERAVKHLEIEKPVCQREIIAYLSDKEKSDSIAEKFFVFLMKKLSERQAKMSLGSKI